LGLARHDLHDVGKSGKEKSANKWKPMKAKRRNLKYVPNCFYILSKGFIYTTELWFVWPDLFHMGHPITH
jgi:hypothetical protein